MDEQDEFVEAGEEMDPEGRPDPEEESNDRLAEDLEAVDGFQGGEEVDDEREELEAVKEEFEVDQDNIENEEADDEDGDDLEAP